jgi:ABC-type nitrate/sulfonate/bicarbonate transport system ATPase subunit
MSFILPHRHNKQFLVEFIPHQFAAVLWLSNTIVVVMKERKPRKKKATRTLSHPSHNNVDEKLTVDNLQSTVPLQLSKLLIQDSFKTPCAREEGKQ